MLAGPSPEALIGPIAAATSRIRVGSGGVMLPHYSAFKVAETFSLLAGLFPGRIDLGLGRARGHRPADDVRAAARPPPRGPRRLPPAARRAARLSRGPAAGRAPVRASGEDAARAIPSVPSRGCSAPRQQSALWAAELGLPYAFADFINPRGAEIAALYRERFAEHEHEHARPRTAVAAWVICADSDEEAERLVGERADDVHAAAPRRADRGAAAGGGAARSSQADERDPSRPRSERRAILGSPGDRSGPSSRMSSRAYGAEEAIVVGITYSHEARMRSYELLADAFGL